MDIPQRRIMPNITPQPPQHEKPKGHEKAPEPEQQKETARRIVHATYKVEVKNKGGTEYYATSEDGDFMMDGEGAAVSPLDAFLASLGACMGTYIKKYLKSLNVDYSYFKLDIQADLIKERDYSFKDINISLDLDGAILDDLKKHSLLEFIKNCPVHATLKSVPDINVKII